MSLRARRHAVFACLAMVALACQSHPPPAPRPDVVFIIIDTLRADRLPFYGHDGVSAEHLSRLAADGVVFEDVQSSSSWTAPASASIHTSTHPIQHQVVHGFIEARRQSIELNRIPAPLETMAEMLQAAGYTTFAVTDNINICEAEGFDQGFDYFQNFVYEGAAAVNAQVLAWEEVIRAAEPAFVYLHYMDPHFPYNRQEPWYEATGEARPDILRAYDSEIEYVDAAVGALFEHFGWGRETLVLVTSDHGEEFWEHGGTTHGKTLFDEVLRVPLVLSGLDEWRGGRRVAGVVSVLDILPTLAALIGLEARGQHRGVDLTAAIASSMAPVRPHYAHLRRGVRDASGRLLDVTQKSLVYGGYKLVSHRVEDGPLRSLLYDRSADPGEKHDLSGTRPDLVRSLHVDMSELEAPLRIYEADRGNVALTPAQREKLRALGYVQ